jgi:hypothetical protein
LENLKKKKKKKKICTQQCITFQKTLQRGHHCQSLKPNKYFNCFLLTLRARDNRTTLIRFLLDRAVLSDALCEGTHSQVTHQHPVVACAVQARLIRDDAIAFFVMLEVVITAFHICGQSK